MRPQLTCAALLALAAPVAAQSNVEGVTNDAYARSHDYDLVHQRIEIRNFDWDSTSLDGRVTTTLVALRPGLDSVILDAGKRLVVSRIVEARGTSLRSAAHGDTLVVYPARPLAFHDTLRFSIDYHARIDNGRGLTFIEPEGREHRPQQIWSQGEDHNNHFWFPTYDFPNDKMTWELAATVPRQYSVVSNGRLVADRRNPDGTHTVTWRQDPHRLHHRRARLPRPSVVPVDPAPARAGAPMVRRLRDPRELGQHVAQRGLRRVSPGAVLAGEARRPPRGRLLPRRVPPVSADRPAASHAARGARLEQRVSQRRARAAHAAALPGPRAVLGFAPPVPRPARLGKRDLRRSTSGGARRNGRESRLVQEAVGVRRGAPPLRGDGGVRHDGTQADAHGQADANRLREGGQYRPRVRDPEGVPHAGDDSRGDCERGRGSAGRAGSPRADDRDPGARQRADNGGVRRRQHDSQGAHVRPADAVARDSAQAGSGSLEPPVGDRPARAPPGGRRGGGSARRGRNRRRLLPHARGGGRGARRGPRGEHRCAARSRAARYLGAGTARGRSGAGAARWCAGRGAGARHLPNRPEL